MTLTVVQFLHVISMMIFCHCGSSFRIDIKRGPFDGLTNTEINLTCVVDDPSYWAYEIMVMEVGKVGQTPMAIMRNFEPRKGGEFKTNMEIEGLLLKDASQSFLRLTIKNPQTENAGEYQCDMAYLDEMGSIKQSRAYANVTLNDPDTKAVLDYLLKKVSDLENIVQEQGDVISKQSNEIQNQTATLRMQEKQLKEQQILINEKLKKDTQNNLKNLQDQVTKLKEITRLQKTNIRMIETQLKNQDTIFVQQNHSITECREDIDIQEKKLVKQLKKVNGLTGRDSSMTAFSVGLGSDKSKPATIKGGETLVFTEKISMIGNDYNLQTGVFTAPWNGYYVFQLDVTCTADVSLHIDLMVNKIRLATLHAFDQDYSDQSSVGTMVELKTGDQVRPVARYSVRRIHLDATDHYSIFTGYLLKLL